MKSVVSFCVLWMLGSAWAQTMSFVGSAYAIDSNELVYQEEHRLTLDGNRPVSEAVRYLDADGSLVGEKTMTYREPARPGYQLELFRSERAETVTPDADGVRIDSRKSGRVDWPEQAAVIDGGFHYFIVEHFEQLDAGETLEIQFLTATRLDWIGLRVEPIATAGDQLILQLQPQNAVLRWVIDPIELTYSRSQRRLLEYRGLTNLPSGDQGNYQVRIEYRYSELTP